MVGTIKKLVGLLVDGNPVEWSERYEEAVSGYHHRPLVSGKSRFELLYGVRPLLTANGGKRGHWHEGGREVELMALQGVRTSHVLTRSEGNGRTTRPITEFEVGDQVLVGHGKALDPSTKWPEYKSRFYGPCVVKESKHPLYMLQSPWGRHSRVAIHPRRLIMYHPRPDYLQ